MKSNNLQIDNSAAWEPCPTGSLGAFAKAEQQVRFQSNVKKLSVGVVTAGVLAVAVWFGVKSSPEQLKAMGCRQVIASLEAYFSDSMEQNDQLRVTSHLAHCKKCWKLYGQYAKQNDLPFNVELTKREKNDLVSSAAVLALLR